MKIIMIALIFAVLVAFVYCLAQLLRAEKMRDKLLGELLEETISIRDGAKRNPVRMPIDVIVEAARSAMNGSFGEGQEP